MARDFIKIDRTAPNTAIHAAKLIDARNVLRDAYSKLLEILAIMTHENDGTVFTDIETYFGLPAGKGQTVFNLVNGTVGAMQGTFQNSNGRDFTETLG